MNAALFQSAPRLGIWVPAFAGKTDFGYFPSGLTTIVHDLSSPRKSLADF